VANALRSLAKKWAFQQERTKEGNLHYQIRLSLYAKKSFEGFKALLDTTILRGAHMSKTAGVNSKNFNYVMKIDSRVRGPWTDSDPNPDDVDEDVFFPETKMQRGCIDYVKGPIDPRKIRVYVDSKGSCGKSVLISKLRFNKLATIIPPTMEKAEDISAMIMCKPVDRAYVVDLPKSITPKKMASFWSALETIKNGYCSDKRNTFRDRVFKKPHLIVFTNKMPNLEFMSTDRWDIIDISDIPRTGQ